ncbi:MAG: lysylphosphatidylglycerol synthase transmembrane domain-containing protein [Bacteroidota bacterium]
MNKAIRTIIQFTLFFGVGFAILYWVYQGQQAAYQSQCDLDFVEACVAQGTSEADCELQLPFADCSLAKKIISDFRGANYFWLFVIIICYIISNISRALRWNQLIRPLGYKPRLFNTFWATMTGYFANLALPRLGEVVKPGLVARYEKIPLEKVFGTIVIDRLMDVFMLASVMGLAFLLEFDKIWSFIQENQGDSTGVPTWILIVGGVFVLFAIIAFVFRKQIMETALFAKIKQILLGFWEGIQSVRGLDNTPVFILHTFIIWVMYFLMTWLCFFAFEPTSEFGPVIGLVVFVFGSLGIVIPSPGGMGSYQFLVTSALVIYGLNGNDGFSFSMIIFVTINLANILFGILAFALLPYLNKRHPVLEPEPQ